MKRENLTFGEALRLLARRAGVELGSRTPEQERAAAHKERLQAAMSAAAVYYHDQLLHSAAGEVARAYLRRRELSDELVKRFQLGYAPDAWEALKGHLVARGYAPADLVAAGLLVEREDGSGSYDRFRHRLIIPIRVSAPGGDRRSQVVAFGGRVLRDEDVPKYLNSPQTPLFDKSATLFGLDMARETIRRWDQAVIVEGYMDVLQAHQHGFGNVVASMGTALTESQLRSLTRLTTNLVLALDADVAGGRATLRGLELARKALDREMMPVITPEGLVRYEGRLRVALHITVLPQGKDPDDVIRADPARWSQLVEAALPVLEYYFQVLTGDLDLSGPKGKAEAVRRLTPILREVGNAVEREHYLQQLARMVRVDERLLASQIATARPKSWPRGVPRTGELAPSQAGFHLGVQEYCLSCLLRSRSVLEWVNDQLKAIGTSPLASADFSRVENQQLFRALSQDAGRQELRHTLDPALHDYLDWLLEASSSYDDLPAENLQEETLKSALQLRQASLHTRVTQIHFLQEDAQSEGRSGVIIEMGEAVAQLREELREVQRAFSRCFSLGRQRLEHTLGLEPFR